MPLDSSIALGVRTPQLADPLQGYANALAVANAQQQNQLHGLQYQNALRAQQDDIATREAIMGAGGDYGKAVNALLSKGLYAPAGAIAKSQQELAKSKVDMDKAKADTMKANLELYSNGISSLLADQSPENVGAFISGMKAKGIDLHAPVPTVLDQESLRKWIQSGAAMSAHGLRVLEAYQPKVNLTDIGGSIQPMNTNTLAGPVGPLAGAAPMVKTATIGEQESQRHNPIMERIAAGNLGVAQGNLRVNQARLANESNPDLQGQLAGAKKAAQEKAEAQVKAAIDLPNVEAQVAQIKNIAEQMIGDAQVNSKGRIEIPKGGKKPHPGFEVSVGASAQPLFQYISGTDKADFYALKDQLTSDAFLQAYKDSLKGGGSITEIEGEKGTQALLRARSSQSEPEFVKAMREFINANDRISSNLKARAGAQIKAPSGWKVEVEK